MTGRIAPLVSVLAVAAALVAVAVLGLAALVPATAAAQTASAGMIRGTVTMATAGAALDAEALRVEVIILSGGSVTGTKAATVEDGAYEMQVDADEAITYIPRAVYQGVSYFAEAVSLRDGAAEATRDFEVYAATTEPPALDISETVLTVVALDRGAGELGFIREDLVRNPTDRVYVGDPSQRITLRLPAPEDTEDAAGENADGRFAFEGGVLTTTTPLRAGETAIVTRYLATYDPVEDRYTLRVTVPVPAERVTVRVPESYVRNLRVEGKGTLAEPQELEIADGEPVTFLVAEAADLGAGDGLVVVLDGFAPEVNSNVLTDSPQAALAAAAALLVVGGAAAYVLGRRRASGERAGEGA